MAFVNPATAGITVGAVDSHHLLGLYPRFSPVRKKALMDRAPGGCHVRVVQL